MGCWLYNKCNHADCGAEHCVRREKLDYLYNCALLSDKQRIHAPLFFDGDTNADFNEFMQLKGIQDNIVDFVNFGKNLHIHSTICGNGKTSWAIRLIQVFFDKIWVRSPFKCRALFVNTPRFLFAVKDSFTHKNEYYEAIRNNVYTADLVVFDDIATKMGTEFELNVLLSIIDARIARGKSTIYTSNTSNLEDMQKALGERLASRICQYSINIELHGRDKRNIGGTK